MRLLPLPGVFQPHSDSIMLARWIEREPLARGSTVLDVCTGSGLLALVAARKGSRVVAIDVSRRAVLAARINATLNGVTVRSLRGDLFAPVMGERFDLIVSNPPYLPGRSDALPQHGAARAWEGGATGRLLLDRICASAHEYLKPGGALLLTHSSVCGVELTLSQLSQRGLEPRVVESRRGPLGPLLRTRADWLRRRGLLAEDDHEEIVIIRAHQPVAATSAGERGYRPKVRSS